MRIWDQDSSLPQKEKQVTKPDFFDVQSSPSLNTGRPREYSFLCLLLWVFSVYFSVLLYLVFTLPRLAFLTVAENTWSPGSSTLLYSDVLVDITQKLHDLYWMQEGWSVQSLARNSPQTIFAQLCSMLLIESSQCYLGDPCTWQLVQRCTRKAMILRRECISYPQRNARQQIAPLSHLGNNIAITGYGRGPRKQH